MESGIQRSADPEPNWNPDAFADRDWLVEAAERLLSVTRAVASAESFDELLRVVAEACLGIGGAESAGIYLTSPDRKTFVVGWEATIQTWPNVRPAGDVLVLSDWHGMTSALETGRPVAWCRNDDVLSAFERAHYLAENVGSGVDVPLVCRNETLGFLKLFRREQANWDARDCLIAEMIGASIALAVSSERLVVRAQEQSRDQRALADLAQTAITPREPRDLLQHVAEQIRQILPFPCVDIELWKTDLDRAEIVAHAAVDGWPGPTNGVVFYRLSTWPSDLRMLRELSTFTLELDDDLGDVERAYFDSRKLVELHYVPLLYGEQCLGAILLQAIERTPLDPRLNALIEEVAAITALVAQAARTQRDTEWERRAQDWQIRVNRMLLNDAPHGTVLEEALAALVDTTEVSVAFAEITEPGTSTIIDRRTARSSVSPRIEEIGMEPQQWAVVRDAIEHGVLQVHRISDDKIDADAAAHLSDLGLEWIVVAPLIHDQRACGALTLLYRTRYLADDDQISFIRQMARQLALTATAYQLRREQEYVAKRSSIMIRVSRAAVSSGDPNDLLQEIARAALEIEQVDACEIERYDPATGLVHNETIAFAGDWGYLYDQTATHQIADLPLFAEIISSNRAAGYLMSDPRISDYERDSFREIGVESVLAIPLEHGNERLGVLMLMRRAAIPFAARTIELANELATHASLALGRAHLFEALQMRANSDGVTGLANHRAILERIDVELERCRALHKPLSLMLIDLDRFKHLNDERGHLTGDRFLREVANAIRLTIGDAGEAARYGGDEFLVMLPDCDERQCSELANELLRRNAECPIVVDGDAIECNFSVGTATAPQDGATRDELVGHADRAMYDAKERGGGRIGHTA